MWLLSTEAIEPSESTLREIMLGFVDKLSALADDGIVDEAFAGHPVRDKRNARAPGTPTCLTCPTRSPTHRWERKVAKAARKAV